MCLHCYFFYLKLVWEAALAKLLKCSINVEEVNLKILKMFQYILVYYMNKTLIFFCRHFCANKSFRFASGVGAMEIVIIVLSGRASYCLRPD